MSPKRAVYDGTALVARVPVASKLDKHAMLATLRFVNEEAEHRMHVVASAEDDSAALAAQGFLRWLATTIREVEALT